MSLKKNEIAACVVVAAGIALALAVGAGVFPTAAVAARLSPTPTPSPSPSPTPAPTPTPEPTPVVETVRFSASGDNLIHEGLYNQARARAADGGYDFTYAYENLRDFYAGFDVNWLNQETLVNDE